MTLLASSRNFADGDTKQFSKLMGKHSDCAGPYYFELFDFGVIGSEIIAERDIVLLTFLLLWMLANALCTIIDGWGFQLNGDTTGTFCHASVDLVDLGVNSIPRRNNVLCLAIILIHGQATESKQVYLNTWDDLRAAVILLCSMKECCVDGCER